MDSATVRRVGPRLLLSALGALLLAPAPARAQEPAARAREDPLQAGTPVPHTSRRLVIDGSLEEWDPLRPLVLDSGALDPRPDARGSWKGSTDASASLAVAWDDDRVVLAGRVVDDVLFLNPLDMFLGDSIEVFLRVPAAEGPEDYQLILCPMAQDVRWSFARFRGRSGVRTDGGFDGVEVAAREVRDEQGLFRGYTFEAALPFANFPGFEPGGPGAGLNVALVDADDGPGQKSYLLWAGTIPPAYDPGAVAPLRFTGSRAPVAGPGEGGFDLGIARWEVPAAILAGTLAVLWLLYLLRRPLKRLGDLPLRRKFLLAAVLGVLAVGARLVPGVTQGRRDARAADRLESARETLLRMADEATRAGVLVPGRTVDAGSPLLLLAEGKRVAPLPRYRYFPVPPVPRSPRRTLGSGIPVRDTDVPLAGAGRVVLHRLPEPVDASALCVVLSWRDPPPGRTPPPAGAVVGRVVAIAVDGTTETLEVRAGREVDDAGDPHAAPESRSAWEEPAAPGAEGAPGHADEVTWKLPGAPRRIDRLEAEQVPAEGTLSVRGITLLPASGGEPLPLALGRTTEEGVPTATWNGQPASEVLRLGPGNPAASVPVDAEADVFFLVYGCPGGLSPELAGKRILTVRARLEDGSSSLTVPLEGGVHVDGESLAGLDHPADFKARIAFRWPGPAGTRLHRDSLEVPAGAAPGVKVRALELETTGGEARVDLDGITAASRLPRPTPSGLSTLRRAGEEFERTPAAEEALRDVSLIHYSNGRAAATTLPADLRDRVLGSEAPPEVRGRGDPALPEGVYLRSVGGSTFLARQVRLPFRDSGEVVEAATPAPGTRDLELPVAVATALLLLLAAPLVLTAAIDLLDHLPHLRWKLVAAFGIAAVLPLAALTLVLARHFEEQVDRGVDQELRALAGASARALAVRRDEARRLAEDLVRDESLLRALDLPATGDRPAQADAALRGLAARAPGARLSLEVTPPGGGRAETATFPLKETPAPFRDLYEPVNGLSYRWSRLVATGVARLRTAGAHLRLVVEMPVDDRALQDLRRAGADRAHILLFSPGGYPVAGTVDLAAERSPSAVAARRAVADDLRRAPGEPEVRGRDVAGLPHAVAYDLVRSADGRTAGLLATAVPRQPLLAATLGTRDLVLLLGSIAFLVAVVVANLVTRRVSGPVIELARVARRIEEGDLRVRAEGAGNDEIASLGVAFNRMTGQLEGRIGELSRLNATLSTFAATLDRARVLDLAVAAFLDSAAPEGILVVLADRERGDLEVAAGWRGGGPLEARRLPADGFLAGAVRGPGARVVPLPAETAEAKAGSEAERALLRGADEAAVLPFAAGHRRTEGAIVLLRASPAAGGGPGAATSLDFLAALAHQAGIALENARLYRLAVEDPSSGLYAASYFKRRLQEEIDRSMDAGRPASLVVLGLEGLEAVFSKAGPDAGNAVLRGVVERIRGEVRRMHLLGRAGRDAVALLLPETPKAAASDLAAALRASLEGAPYPVDAAGREVRLGATPVAVTAPDDAGSAEFLENEALRALEQARARRRGSAPGAGPAGAGPPSPENAEAEALGFRSAKSLLLLDAVHRIAASDVPVLILGETGAGKEVVADLLHGKSRRAAGPLVKVNCAALPAPLLEAELFGYERGAFTGAERRHTGRFEQAHGGTLFLDEIGEMPPALQVKLLRVLQDRRVERLGGTAPVEVDVRIVAATNRDLPAQIEAGAFREDLYFRLNVLSVVVPPLRARREDIPPLAARFLEQAAGKHGGGPTGFTPEALDFLFRHPFPGNVRELRNMVERAVVSSRGPLVTPRDLSFGEEREGLRLGKGPAAPPAAAAARPAPAAPAAPPAGEDAGLGERAGRLLALLRREGTLTNRQWCDAAGVSARTGLRDFEELMGRGLARRSGKRRSASYAPR